MLSYFATNPCSIRGRVVIPQFSKNQELTGGPGGSVRQHTSNNNSASGESPNRILLVTIQNPLYPITVDVLNQVFSPYGNLEKIVIFSKTAGLQALVQYARVEQAVQAKTTLHGQNIYAGSCTLHIQFSNLSDLTVKANTDKTRDFANPSLPTEAPNRQRGNLASPASSQGSPFQLGQLGHLSSIPGMTVQMMQQIIQQQQQQQASSGMSFPGGNATLMTSPFAPTDKSVLLVSSLNPDTDCDMLFNLFSNYGNVVRIKILHNKRDRALVQMGDNFQATTAMMYLKGVNVLGSPIDVVYSKYPYIASGPDPTGQDQNTKDYANSGQNRFVKAGSKNFKYITVPGNMLHLSNLTPNVSEDSIRELLNPFGAISNLKIFESSGKRQCLLQFMERDSAVDALIHLHNKPFEGLNLRVAFSKSTI